MADVYTPSEFRFAIAPEVTLGTAITVDTSFKELYITEQVQMDYGGIIREKFRKSGSGKVISLNDVYVSKNNADYTIQVNGVATSNTIDLLLYGIMQDLSSASSATPYLKTWHWDEASTFDFTGTSALAGEAADAVGKQISFTIGGYDPTTSELWSVTGAILKELTLTSDPGTNGGRLSYSATFYSGHTHTRGAVTDSNLEGINPDNWVSPNNTFYLSQSITTKKIASNAVVLGGFNITLNNQAVRTGYGSAGYVENYSLGVSNDGLQATGELKVKYDATTKAELAAFLSNPQGGSSADKLITIQWGDETGLDDLKILFNVIYSGHALDFANEAGVFVNLPFETISDSSNKPVVITATGIDRWGTTV